MSFFVIKIMLIEPIETYGESSYKLVKKIEDLRPADTKLTFCGIDRDGEALKYLINLKPRSKYYVPTFIALDNNKELLNLEPGTLVIFKSSKTKFIKPEVKQRLIEVAKGDLGHRECTVYELRPKRDAKAESANN